MLAIDGTADKPPRWINPQAAAGCRMPERADRDLDDRTTTIGELLSWLRLATGVSQTALGHAAGVHASYVHRLESGERTPPTREAVLALARALQATPVERDRLLGTAGYLPLSLQTLGLADSTLSALIEVLTNHERSLAARTDFRAAGRSTAAHPHKRSS